MQAIKTKICPEDLMNPVEYAKIRREQRRAMIGLRDKRRVFVGPHAVFSFECFETLLGQVQEMLHIEGAPEGQLEEELEAYNPLMPQGENLSAVLMFEIPSAVQRDKILPELAGVEDKVWLAIDGERMAASAAPGPPADLKAKRTSSVHFLHFPLTAAQRKVFASAEIALGFDHPAYRHQTFLTPEMRQELTRDFAN